MAMQYCNIRITKQALDPAVPNFSQNEGAVIDFFGVVRIIENERMIDGIEYEAFEAMAERQLALIADEAGDRYGLVSVMIHHRIGFVRAGEVSLFVRVTARHRRAAFEGSSQIIDRLKQLVPIWKHPVYASVQTA
jgi:molybdopterin synthase catalytic subunit